MASIKQPSDREAMVEVVYALPERQWLIEVPHREGMTVLQAIQSSGILDQLPDLSISDENVGIFSRKSSLGSPVQIMDRVEIYRELICDPKEVRRRKAAEKASQVASQQSAV